MTYDSIRVKIQDSSTPPYYTDAAELSINTQSTTETYDWTCESEDQTPVLVCPREVTHAEITLNIEHLEEE